MIKIMKNLYVGNMEDAILASQTKSVKVIIYVGQKIPTELSYSHNNITVVHIPLVDGENDELSIHLVLLNVAYLVLDDDKTLVACRQGMSRSPTVIVAYLAVYGYNEKTKNRFQKAFTKIHKLIPNYTPVPELLKSVKEACETYFEVKK